MRKLRVKRGQTKAIEIGSWFVCLFVFAPKTCHGFDMINCVQGGTHKKMIKVKQIATVLFHIMKFQYKITTTTLLNQILSIQHDASMILTKLS